VERRANCHSLFDFEMLPHFIEVVELIRLLLRLLLLLVTLHLAPPLKPLPVSQRLGPLQLQLQLQMLLAVASSIGYHAQLVNQ